MVGHDGVGLSMWGAGGINGIMEDIVEPEGFEWAGAMHKGWGGALWGHNGVSGGPMCGCAGSSSTCVQAGG